MTTLFDEHASELRSSAVDDQVAKERGYETVGRPTSADQRPRQRLQAAHIPSWATSEDRYYPGLLIPLWGPTGSRTGCQWKPRVLVANRDGKKMKYASQRGRASVLDVHPRWTTLGEEIVPPIRDTGKKLWITEGVKKADSLTSRGCVTVALNGVYSWRSTLGTLGDWEDVPLKAREVVVCFDADAMEKTAVLRAMQRLGAWLHSKGAAKVWYVLPPAEFGGVPTKGVDDYFAAGGTLDDLVRRATTTAPRPKSEEDMFTDSALAELVASEVMEDRLLHVRNIGWRVYDGRRWRDTDDGTAVEAVREFFRDQYREALTAEAEAVRRGEPVDGNISEQWRCAQSARKISAVVSLARNIDTVIADLDSFDTHHDLINTPGGVVHLATGESSEHDPTLRLTKITAVDYVPGAETADWKTALQAVPADAQEWLEVRLGQAITGYEPDDDRLLLFQGGGSNGKTVLLGAVRAALGSYAAAVPNTLLLSSGKNGGQATPEKMTLQGIRVGYMEETAEGRHLDVQALKEVVGNRRITARQLYKGYVEFGTTHALFLNTNPLPEVRDTDNGTWRRLLRVPFPYRYRLPGEQLELDADRVGDPGIKRRLVDRPERANQEAVLAWLMVGAMAWYMSDQSLEAVMPVPESVRVATAEWREQADPVLAFFSQHVEIRPGSWILLGEFTEVLAEWMQGQRLAVPAARLLTTRVKDHSGLPVGVEVKKIRTGNVGPPCLFPSRYGLSRRPPAVPQQTFALSGAAWRLESSETA